MKLLVDPHYILNELRERIGMSNYGFAGIAFYSGVGKSTIRSIWDGSHTPHSKNIRKVARWLDIEIGDFEGHIVDSINKNGIHYSLVADSALVSRQYVYNIMRGRYKPSLTICMLLSDAVDKIMRQRRTLARLRLRRKR